ncbi:response regulator transcription factor [Sedimentisphaera salicampi]|uniref:Response regulator UvrY n=1 Tax=Sedimentisphaera salicampi TaxID=1941349 RepID=A0A1W6LKQ2_9BACT|nr:response regulator transcription factor [Sedimentisphaera salicampi]ARN56349.1 Response regulator UvrY [Sedimentisphaera salicampi]OXU15232.1 Response regulator UvrY [Sedimentisphaera salicampi]
MIEILVCDDHAVVREGLKLIIESSEDISVKSEAGSGEEAVALVTKHAFDAVILDISMEGMGGIEALNQIKNTRPDLPVLMLSMHPEDQYAVRVLKAGAAGYLTKKSASEDLLEAVRTVYRGRKFITPAVSRKLVDTILEPQNSQKHEGLSDREYQVLIMLGKGKSLGEISDELHLSPKTVSTYKTRIMNKMGISNNAELIRYCIENSLV